jgi:prepilin-type N-terminal cleavage/methylation domain-containing protein
MLSSDHQAHTRNRAFTLIELMIVVAIIAIIAAIAIPGLLRSKMSTNESSTIGSLKTIASGQIQFKGSAAVDQDNDGDGEFGFLGEMSGISNCRTAGGLGKPKLLPGVLSQGLGIISGGSVAKAGYEYRMYLPTAAGLAIHQTAMTAPNGVAADANRQENNFICYAWPAVAQNTGGRCFVVGESGEILAASNLSPTYQGKTAPAPPEAAMNSAGPDPDNLDGGLARSGLTASDGQTWVPAQ